MGERIKQGTIRHIASRTGVSEEHVQTMVTRLLNQGYNKAQIYGILMEGNGTPPSHVSARRVEGEPLGRGGPNFYKLPENKE